MLVALIGAGAVGWWSAGIASRPVATLPEPSGDIWFTVEVGEVGSTREVPVTGQWDAAATVTAAGAGVLTERLVDDGATVESGSVVGTVDLQPIVVAEGSVPSFRTLSRNARGQDVAQLQELLVAQGLLASDAIDGAFGRATERAVRDWEEDLGLDTTGTVPLGRLVFVPGLPARARWLADVGDSISPGMPLLELLDASPRFSATVSPSLLADLPPQADVDIVTQGADLPAKLGESSSGDADLIEVRLVARDDSPVCPAPCAPVDIVGQTRLTGRVTLVPATSGARVPVAAITIDDEGATTVTVRGEGERPVTVLASAGGFAIVEGASVGDAVLIPGPSSTTVP